jgi:glycosyltransferase involved in cell wall biosynthesis
MNILREPKWLKKFNFEYARYEDIPYSIFDQINQDLNKVQGEDPLVSVVVAAWNEEVNILNCVASLSQTRTNKRLEIIVINNNSTDKTQETLNRLQVKSFFQRVQGWGPARQMGLEKSRGKYILLADADCIYPEKWVDEMVKNLQEPGVVCVYGRYSFISEPGYPRWQLYLLEKMKDAIAELRHLKRPYLNAFGMSMGYIREYGVKVGYVMHKIKGEDGRMCFDLMQFGKVRQVKTSKARIWTRPRSLQRDGSLGKAMAIRIGKEIKRISTLFTPHPPHNTKTSTND